MDTADDSSERSKNSVLTSTTLRKQDVVLTRGVIVTAEPNSLTVAFLVDEMPIDETGESVLACGWVVTLDGSDTGVIIRHWGGDHGPTAELSGDFSRTHATLISGERRPGLYEAMSINRRHGDLVVERNESPMPPEDLLPDLEAMVATLTDRRCQPEARRRALAALPGMRAQLELMLARHRGGPVWQRLQTALAKLERLARKGRR